MASVPLFDRAFAPAGWLVAALSDQARRERTVIAVLVAYVAIWTLYGVLAKGSQDVHADMAEVVAWSRDLAWGYSKHPPLSAWVTAGWFALFPLTDASFYLLAMTMAGLALWIAWHLAGDYLDAERRVLALVILMLVPFFNFHALKFNANTVLMPLWAATTLCFLRSYERRSAGWAVLAGLFAAGAMLGKYWSVFLLMGLGIAALLDARRAGYFRSSAPWITIAVGAVAMAPHLVWLVGSDFAPIKYASVVHAAETGVKLTAVQYLTGSVASVVLAVVLALAVIRPNLAAVRDILWPKAPERRLAAAAFWWPFLLPVLAPLLADFSITPLWSMSAWTLLPVVVLSSPLVALHRDAMWATVAIAVALPPVMVAAAPAIANSIHRDQGGSATVHSRLLAERIGFEWRRVTDKPLRTVTGDSGLAEGAAFYLPSRPRTESGTDRERLLRDGFVIVCYTSPECLARASKQGVQGSPIDVEITRSYRGVAGRVGHYAIVVAPPRP